MVLNKRIKRIFYKNTINYIAIFLLVVMSSFLVVAFGGTTYTARKTVENNWKVNNVENGEFTTYVPLTNKDLKKLNDKSVTIEKMFYMDIESEEGKTVRIFKNRDTINKIQLKSGKLAKQSNEINLEYTFADNFKYKTGDTIKVGNSNYQVMGTCTVPDYAHRVQNISDVGTDEKFGIGFVNTETFKDLLKDKKLKNKLVYNYVYVNHGTITDSKVKDMLCEIQCDKDSITDTYIKSQLEKMQSTRSNIENGFENILNASKLYNSNLETGVQKVYNGVEKYLDKTMKYDLPVLKFFTEKSRNSRITGIIQYNEPMLSYAVIAGILLSTIIAYILTVFAVNNIKKDSVSIGTLFSLGITKKELIYHYMILPILIVMLGSIAGTILGINGVTWFMASNYSYPLLIPSVSPSLLAYGIIMPLILTVIINFLVLNKKLSMKPLQMMHPEKYTENINLPKVKGKSFERIFKKTQFLREKRSYITLFMGIGFAIIFMMLGLSLYSTIENYADKVTVDMKYNYMYLLQNPLEKQPDNTEVSYTKPFTIYCKQAKADMDVILQGINSKSKYFDFASDLKNDHNLVYVSDSAVVKYGYSIGDKITFTDHLNNRDYTFTVAGIVPFKNGIYFFMDIDAMRKYFKVDDTYYNTLFSNEKTDIKDTMLINTITKNTIYETAKSWLKSAKAYLPLFLGVGVVTFIITMYLLVKTIIEHAASNISLMKILGYTNKEVEGMYLGNLKYVVLLDIIVFVPLSALLMRSMIPLLNATMGSGMATYIKPSFYVILILFILLVFYFIFTILKFKVRKITFMEVLKNRE